MEYLKYKEHYKSCMPEASTVALNVRRTKPSHANHMVKNIALLVKALGSILGVIVGCLSSFFLIKQNEKN